MGRIKKQNQAFTLIEMLIVIGIIGLILPVFFNTFFIFLRQQAKIYALSQIKREGDFILNTLTNTIRNYAVSIHSSIPPNENNKINCPQLGTLSILNNYFLDKYGNYFRFCRSSTGSICDNQNNYIASYSSILSPSTIALNTNKVSITNFNLSCSQSSPFSPPVITVTFTISYGNNLSSPEETASLTYLTQIKMKSY